ncbi:FOG: TPR repeat [Hahella chejuensis KCTC 2396]|uniref:FOG: TPR repeat n=1 Tax=Hahella chejuensis (strain KCTC 2396) TaxID=349521 RepID=Q2SAS6_HAHCH|nr:poly-beta-1,6 N-acetyl-D-glucosamine export porin PgaA [Hahella chejuensis]ABC32248.1 FOG: TPR repeat [Hahella chejuensis KCTC 2396]
MTLFPTEPSIRLSARKLARLVVSAVALSQAIPALAASPVDEKREQFVISARAGHLKEAIKGLSKLYKQTHDKAVLNDLIALYSWNGELDSALALCNPCSLKALNNDSLAILAKAQRNQKNFATAAELYRLLTKRSPKSRDAWLGLALTSAEMGEDVHAQKAIANYRELTRPSVERFENELYIMTVLQDKVGEIGVLQDYYSFSPDNRDIGLRLYKAAIDLGAATAADRIVKAHPDWFKGIDHYWLEYYKSTLNIRSGAKSSRPDILDKGIADLQALYDKVPAEHSLRGNIERDIFYGLVVAKRFDEASDMLPVIETRQPLPAYIEEARADLYAANRRPFKALPIFKQLYAQAPTLELGKKLYYAHMDAEQYEEGGALLQKLLDAQPPRRWDFTGSFKVSNENYQQLREQSIIHQAWSGDLDSAEKSLQAALVEAPGNPWLWMDLGNVQRWQGRFSDAEYSYRRADSMLSGNAQGSARRSLWLTQLEKGDWRGLNAKREELNAAYPAHEQREINKRWDEASAPFLSVNASRVKSSNSKPGQAQNSREWRYDARLYSQRWEGQRIFIHDQKMYGEWEERDLFARYTGVGADLSFYPFTLELEAGSGGKLNDKAYFWSTASWTLFDDLSLQASYRYNPSETPLRGLYDESYMRQWGLGATYRFTPRISLGTSASLSNFTDGNDRQAISAWLETQLWQTPRYKLSGVVSAGGSDNDKVPASYFNPTSDRNYGAELRHSYRIKVSDDWDLDQFLETRVNQYRQEGYDPAIGWEISYSQQWRWRDQVSVRLGVSRDKATYDGEPENGTLIFANFEMRFMQ